MSDYSFPGWEVAQKRMRARGWWGVGAGGGKKRGWGIRMDESLTIKENKHNASKKAMGKTPFQPKVILTHPQFCRHSLPFPVPLDSIATRFTTMAATGTKASYNDPPRSKRYTINAAVKSKEDY